MTKKNTDANLILLSAFIIITAFLSKYSMPLFFVSIFITGVFNCYIVCNFTIDKIFFSNISTVVFLFVTSHVNQSLGYLDILIILLVLVPGIIIGCVFRKGYTFKDGFAALLLFYSLVIIGCIAFCRYAYDLNFTQEIRDFLTENFSNALTVFKTVYPDLYAQISEMENDIFNIIYVVIPGVVPFALGVIFTFVSLLQYAFCKIACNAFLIKLGNFSNGFDVFKPGLVTNIVFAIMFITVFFDSNPFVSMVALNVLLFIMLLYFITTVSFIEYKLKQIIIFRGRRMLLISALILGVFLVTTMFPVINAFYAFVFFGILDSIFDFRKINVKKVS